MEPMLVMLLLVNVMCCETLKNLAKPFYSLLGSKNLLPQQVGNLILLPC